MHMEQVWPLICGMGRTCLYNYVLVGRKSPFLDPVGLDKNSNCVIQVVLKVKSLSYLFLFLQVKIKLFHSHVERCFIMSFLFITK